MQNRDDSWGKNGKDLRKAVSWGWKDHGGSGTSGNVAECL